MGSRPGYTRATEDVIDLYVFSRPTTGYPEGIQLASEPFTRHSPFIGEKGPWTVTVPLDSTLGQPARCMVAAQPTMGFQGAPCLQAGSRDLGSA